MFNDERINLTLGKIYKKCILFSLLIAFIVCGVRSIYYTRELEFTIYLILPELLIIASGFFALLGEILFVGIGRDERTAFQRSNYYRNAFRVFIFVILCALAVSIPLYCITLQFALIDSPFNSALICSAYLCFIYIIFSFKRNNLNFNYSIIEKNKRDYYIRVFANIIKIVFVMLPSCIISVVLMRVFKMNIGVIDYSTAIKVCIALLIVSSLLYFLLSVAEKRSYDSQDNSLVLDDGSKLLFVSNFIVFILYKATNLYQYYQTYFNYDYSNSFFKKFLVLFAVSNLFWILWTLLSVSSLCCFLKFAQKNKWIKISVSALIVTESIDLFKNVFNSFFDTLSIEKHAKILKTLIIPGETMLSFLQCFLFAFLVIALIKAENFKKILIISPLINFVASFTPIIYRYAAEILNIVPPSAFDSANANLYNSFIGLAIQFILLLTSYIIVISVIYKKQKQ